MPAAGRLLCRVLNTILSRGRRWRGGGVLLKVVPGLSVLIAVRLQELGSHRQTGSNKKFRIIEILKTSDVCM